MQAYGWLAHIWGSKGHWWKGGHGGGAGLPTPINQVDYWDGDITAEVGTTPSFARASSVWFPTDGTDSSWTEFTTGNPCTVAYPYLTATTNGGIALSPLCRNEILQSENPATTWTTVGAPTSVNNGSNTGPDGTASSAGDITASGSGDGIEQDSGIAAASKKYIFSVFVRAPVAPLAGTITLEGIGGTPETANEAFTATSSWQRVSVYTSFTAAATGNCKPKIVVGAAAVLHVWGMMLEMTTTYPYRKNITKPFSYIPTTVAAGASASDLISYGATYLNTVTKLGSLSFWLALAADNDSTNPAGGGRGTFGMGVNQLAHNFETAGNSSFVVSAVGASFYTVAGGFSALEGEWTHYLFTWDTTADIIKTYTNGVLRDTVTSARNDITTSNPTRLGVASNRSDQSRQSCHGVYSGYKLYDTAFGDADALALYNSEKADFGK